MGAETRIYVLVDKLTSEWVEVPAVTLEQAEELAGRLPHVARVRFASYDSPDDRGADHG